MSEQLFNQFADIPALEKQKEQILAIYSEIKGGIKTLSDIGVKIQQATSVKEINSAQKDYVTYLKDTESLKKKLLDSEKQLADSQKQYAKLVAANKEELRKQNAELKTQAEYNNANTGSIERARAAIKQLSAERNKLNLFTKEGQLRQAELNEQIDKYNQFIKKNVDALSQQKINVGNYQGSAKIIVDALEKEKKKLEELESTRIRVQNAGASPLSPAAAGGSNINRTQITGFAGGKDLAQINKEIENSRKIIEGFSRVTENPRFLNIAAKVGDANAELKGMTKSLIELERAGLGETQGANELRQSLAKLTDEVADTRQEIKALSSDSRQFDLFAGSVSFAADAFQTLAGAAQLAGASEEDTAEALKTLIAVQAVSNGVKGIANELTTKGTAANKLYAYSTGLVTVATDASASATARLAAASKLLLFGGIIAAIAYLVVKYQDMKKAAEEAARSTKLLSDINKEAAQTAGQQIATLKTLYTVATNTTLSIKERKKAVDELQSQYPDYFKNLNDEIILNGKATKAYDAAKLAILELAKAKAIESKLTELSSKELDLQAERLELTKKQGVAEIYVLAQLKKASGEGFDPKGIAASVGQQTQNLRLLQSELKGINSQLAENQKNIQNNAKDQDFLLSFIKKAPETTRTTASPVKAAEKDVQVRYSLQKGLYDKLEALQVEHNAREIELTEVQQGTIKEMAEKAGKDITLIQLEELQRFEYAENRKKELLEGLTTDIQGIFFDALTARQDAKQAELDKDLQDIETRKQAEIEAINASGLSETEKAQRVTAAEKQALSDKKKIEEEKQRLAKRTKEIQKLAGVAEIAATTAIALFDIQRKAAQARAEAALLSSNPLTAALAPNAYAQSALILGQIPGVLVNAGVQLARLAFFKKGTMNAPAGPAIVSEEGNELLIDKSGSVKLTPSTPTLMQLSGGEKILPHNITKDILNAVGMTHLLGLKNFSDVPMSEARINQHLQEKMLGELQDLNKKSRIVINNQLGIESSAYYLNNLKN